MIFQKNVISRSQKCLNFSVELDTRTVCLLWQSSQRQNNEEKDLHFALADRNVYLYHYCWSRGGHETQGGFLHGSHFFLWPPFLLGKLPLFFSGICSAGNWHRVSCLMLHYEIVNNIFRKGEELFINSFCIFHVSYFPVSVRVIVFVTVLDECRNGATRSNVVAAGLHCVIQHASPGSVLPGRPNLWVGQAAMTYVQGMQSFYQRCVSSWFLHHS